MINYKDHPVFHEYDYVAGNDPGGTGGLSIFDRFGLQSTGYHIALPTKEGMERRNIGMAYSLVNEISEVTTSEMAAYLASIGKPTPFPPRILFVIENNVVYGKSRAGAAMTQREMIAVTAAYAHKAGYDVMRVVPKEAKIALTGNGSADKPQMVAAVRLEFPGIMEDLSSKAKREAVADSMGIAMAGMDKYIKQEDK